MNHVLQGSFTPVLVDTILEKDDPQMTNVSIDWLVAYDVLHNVIMNCIEMIDIKSST